MNNIIENARALKSELENTPLIQEYKKIKVLYESSEEIKELKKQIVRAKNENRLDDQQNLKNIYDKHPLVMNYLSLKEEVSSLLKEICDIINI